MKKPRLLLLAGYFPPVKISVGSIRPWNLVKYLQARGWEVTIVTPEISIWNHEHLDSPEQVTKEIRTLGFNMIYTGHRYRFLSPDRYKCLNSGVIWFLGGLARVFTRSLGISNWIGWKTSAIKACSHLKPNDVDVILSTGAPFVGFEIAYLLGKRLKKPYFLDYRDLWTRNAYSIKKFSWVINMEKFLLERSAGVSVVAPTMKACIETEFKIQNKIHVITNGYDPDEFKKYTKTETGVFKIIYAGTLLPPQRTLAPVLKALRLLDSASIKWEFHYFGQDTAKAREEVLRYNLEDQTFFHEAVSKNELYLNIKNADLAIVLHLSSSEYTLEEKGWIPGKVYELIGLQTQMLVITPRNSDIEEIVKMAGLGSCFASDETERIALFISQAINGKKILPKSPEYFSWEYLSGQFDNVLRDVIN